MTDRRPGPHRIDVHAHYLAPAYKEALQEADAIERAGALAQFGHLGGGQDSRGTEAMARHRSGRSDG